jgi:tripartite-type tricarboxylate transporter receptor subunit TctC
LVVGDSGSLVIAAIANPALTYAPLKDLVPISLVTAVSIVVCVKPDSPVRDLADLIARARAQPGNLTLGTAGVGSPSHLAYELLSAMTGVKMLHVPYKGGAPLTVAAIAGEIDVMIDGAAFAQVKSGRLRAIAVTGPRLSALPGVPSIGEFVKGFEFTNWWGILAPAGAPPDVVRMLNLELSAIAAMPEVEERLTGLGLSARSSSPEQFGDFLRAEIEKIGGVVKSAGIKLN